MGKLIQIEKYTPSVYYQQSRDFQLLGRLYDVVLNNIKLNSDLIYNLPLSDDSDSKLIDLMSLTLGFKSKHNYNVKQLTALCSAFAEVIRNKGNISSIKKACDTLLHAEGILEETQVEVIDYSVVIFVPSTLSDINLLNDLLNYIIPAGMTCQIIREATSTVTAATNISYDTIVNIYKDSTKAKDIALSVIPTIIDTDSFILTVKEPDNWDNTYKQYYRKSSAAYSNVYKYEKVNDAKAPTWEANTFYAADARAKDYKGLFVNSSIVRPSETRQANNVEGEN